MGQVIQFHLRARDGDVVRDIPFCAVAHHVARLLGIHEGESLEIQLRFHMNGRVTMINGWPEPEYLHLPYDSGHMTEFEEILTTYERCIDNGTEENPALVKFYQASPGDYPASWGLASEESVKFPLRDEDL